MAHYLLLWARYSQFPRRMMIITIIFQYRMERLLARYVTHKVFCFPLYYFYKLETANTWNSARWGGDDESSLCWLGDEWFLIPAFPAALLIVNTVVKRRLRNIECVYNIWITNWFVFRTMHHYESFRQNMAWQGNVNKNKCDKLSPIGRSRDKIDRGFS